MSTSEALAKIEAGKFEQLVAGYLRRQEPELTGLISTGVNEDGETIVCPVDAILYVSGPPPKYISVACTTDIRGKLRGKWLGENTKEGDLPKAAKDFATWLAINPAIECVLSPRH